jgi:predicted double-glycine peptidase
MTAEEMAEFVKAAKHFKTASGQDGMYVDLTDKLSGDMTQSKTIFGAVVQTEEYTVFVKAMGEQSKVAAQKSLVIAFCKSLKIAGPKS